MKITDESPIIVPVDNVLEALDHGNKWTQGVWEGADGSMCLHQGIRVCQVQAGDAFLIERVAERQGWGIDWNDEPGRSFDDIKSRLVEHREVFPHELEETFGPQWAAVCGIVREAATLTPRQVSELSGAAARDARAAQAARAAGDAAWAARDARAAQAARAAWAAGDAAGDAGAAWAARDAARAVAVRHLIGQHGFTQEHYDTSVARWESVMGHKWTREAA